MNIIKKTSTLILLGIALIASSQEKPFEVEVKGQGEHLLLLPGFTCTGEVWDDLVTELSKTHTCHVFTFAGFGDVPPITKPWLPKIKDGLIDYIAANKLDAPVVIGHSLGGTLGLWLGTEEQNSYKRIIVVDALPSAGALMIPNYKSENIVYDNPYNKQLLEMNAEKFAAMARQTASFMTLATEKIPQLVDWIVQADRETYVYGYTDLLKLDLRETIGSITTPVTILAATHPYGLETAKKNYTKQYKNLKSYDIAFAEGAAHFIMYDKKEWFLEEVKKALKN